MKKYISVFSALLTIAFTAISLFSTAQNGMVDTTFYNNGAGFDDLTNGGMVLPDSSVLVWGSFLKSSERSAMYIAKLKQDGTNDYSFTGPNWGTASTINSVTRQADGKLLVSFAGGAAGNPHRLNTDGTVDGTFSGGTTNVAACAMLSSQKIIAVGAFTTYSGASSSGVVKLNTNGTRDTSFHGQ